MKLFDSPPWLEQMVRMINSVVDTEKIFLLGSGSTRFSCRNIFANHAAMWRREGYLQILVLTSEKEIRGRSSVEDIIESHCRELGSLTALVIPALQFRDWLEAGHYFACFVMEHAPVCYDAGRVTMKSDGQFCAGKFQEQLKKQGREWQCRGFEFFTGAQLYMLRKQYKLGAFLLHQAAEHALVGLIFAATGFRACTHNLDKLLRFAMGYSDSLGTLFPCHTEKELQLFRLLQKAYIGARYKDDYTIKGEQLEQLSARVRRLLDIAKEEQPIQVFEAG